MSHSRRDSARLDAIRAVISDDAGHFDIGTVPQDEYNIFAFEDINVTTELAPTRLKFFESKSKRVTLEPGRTAKLQLDVITVDSLAEFEKSHGS